MQRFLLCPGRGLRCLANLGAFLYGDVFWPASSRVSSTARSSYSYDISEDLLMEILKRLSIEDLVRCIAVCKSWYSLITSPSFIALHSQHHETNNNKALVLVRDYPPQNPIDYHRLLNPKKELYSLHFDDDETFQRYKRLDCPVASVFKNAYLSVVGCVNGVVCLSDDLRSYSEIIHLWNPSIRKYVTLPFPIFGYLTHGAFMHSVGFGFDATTNAFKVVRVVYLMDRMPQLPPYVEIYEPRVGSWREVDAKGFSRIIDERSPQVFLHGIVHWVTSLWNSTVMIASFDLRTEEFCVIKVPESLNEHRLDQNFCVSVLDESLCLLTHHAHSNIGNTCCIWVMKQYGVPDSWTKLFTIDVVGRFWWVFGFRRSGEALVKVSSEYRDCRYVFSQYPTHQNLLVSFEPKSSQGKLLAGFGDWKSLYVDTFVESLALLGVKCKSADSISADEDSFDPDDHRSRYLEPTNPSRPSSIPLGEVVVSWFGRT